MLCWCMLSLCIGTFVGRIDKLPEAMSMTLKIAAVIGMGVLNGGSWLGGISGTDHTHTHTDCAFIRASMQLSASR
jgi:hypothetical protein